MIMQKGDYTGICSEGELATIRISIMTNILPG